MNTVAEKYSQLGEIERAQVMLSIGARGPRHLRGLRQSVVCAAGSIALTSAIATWLNPYMPGIKDAVWLMLGVALMAGIWSYRLALRDPTTPAAWVEVLDTLLTRYEPVNQQAFDDLMHALRTKGEVDTGQFVAWIGGERLALRGPVAPLLERYTAADLPSFAARSRKEPPSVD